MTHAVDLIAATLTKQQKYPLPVTPERGICCVTGAETDTIPRRKLFGANFMDANLLIAPDSNRVGVKAWHAMQFGEAGLNDDGTRKKRRKKPEMQACWWTDGREFRIIGKPEIRQMVLSGAPSTPWAGWVTTSYKKHGALRAPVNPIRFGIWGFDDVQVDCRNIDDVKRMWMKLRNAQSAGVGRKSIETLEIPSSIALRVGLDTWTAYEQWARQYYQSPMYKFLTYLLPSQAELKGGYNDAYLYD